MRISTKSNKPDKAKTTEINEKQIIENLIDDIKAVSFLSENVHLIFDYKLKKLLFISEGNNFPSLTPYTTSSYNLFSNNVDRDDAHLMDCIHKRALTFLMKQKVQERIDFVFTMHLHITSLKQKTDAKYSFKPQILDTNGGIWLIVGLLEKTDTFSKPQVENVKTGEKHHFKPLPVSEYKTYKETLTKKEDKILQQLASNEQMSQICSTLNITESTYKKHRSNIYKKLNAHSRISAINKAFSFGLLKI